MHQFDICVSKKSGKPYVIVPQASVWSLVEYLAFRRVHADFSYSGEDFLALFPRLSAEGAQQVLDDWAGYEIALQKELTDSAPASSWHEQLKV